MNETTNKPNKKNEVGALWKKVSTSGSEYFSGYVSGEDGERIKVVAFENTYKKPGESTPDFRIFVSEMRQADPSDPSLAKNKPAPAKNSKPPETQVVDEISEDDIPF